MASTVTVFDPQGVMHDVPQAQLADAVKNGGTPGVRVQSPDGQIHIVPAPKIMEAAHNGGKILPIEQQETAHPGFWSTVADNALPMLKSLLTPSGQNPYPGMGQEEKAAAAAQSHEEDTARKQAGYSKTYRALAPVAETLGTNVPGMEQAATEGDPGAVAAHATMGATLAASPLIAEGLYKGGSAALDTPLGRKATATVAPGARAVGRVFDVATFDRITAAYKAAKGIKGDVGEVRDIWKSKPKAPAEAPTGPAAQLPEGFTSAIEPPPGSAGNPFKGGKPPIEPPAGYKPVTKGVTEPEGGAGGQGAPPAVEPTPGPAPQTPLQQASALKQPIREIVDQAVPPEHQAANLEAHAAVDFYLKKGNVAGAETALEEQAKKVGSTWPPPDYVRPDPVQFSQAQPARPGFDVKGTSDAMESRAIEDAIRSRQTLQDWKSSFRKVSDAELSQSEGYKTFFERNKGTLEAPNATQAQAAPTATSDAADSERPMMAQFGQTIDQKTSFQDAFSGSAKPREVPPGVADLTSLLEQSVRQIEKR